MKRLAFATAMLLFAAISAPAALAETQQERMTQCNADAKAKNLSGDARKAFMSSCLSGKNDAAAPATPATPASKSAATPAAGTTQQDKMAACNKEAGAKGLKGDERKAFMSNCLSGKHEAATPATPASQSTAATPATQQEKMTACNKEASAKGLKGDERKAFMSSCLKG